MASPCFRAYARPRLPRRPACVRVYIAVIYLILLSVVALASDIHGGTLLAMRGHDAVVLAADSRYTSYRTGSFLLGQHPRILFQVGPRCIVGCIGLDSDARQLMADVREKVKDHVQLEPRSVARVVSNILYRSRLMLSPIVCGIDSDSGPYICSMDGLGAQTVSANTNTNTRRSANANFAVTGSAAAGLYAICESEAEGLGLGLGLELGLRQRPTLATASSSSSSSSSESGESMILEASQEVAAEAAAAGGGLLGTEQLCAFVSRCMRLAMQRDMLSGCDVSVHILHADGRLEKRTVTTHDV